MTGTIALAQQPAEWRPSIAEDNKAATLSDTFDFMVNSIRNDGGGNRHKYLRVEMLEGGILHLEDRITDLNKFRTHIGNNRIYIIPVQDLRIKLSSIDPLSIVMVRDDDSFAVKFSGHNDGAIGTIESAIYEYRDSVGAGTDYAKYRRESVKMEYPCSEGIKNCAPEPASDVIHGSLYFSDDEEEIAKRFARALMHAALLCGGAKAVSPF
jgi:hypothetical protein